MKKISYLTLLILLLGIGFGCKKEQAVTTQTNTSFIIGKSSQGITITSFDTSVNIIAPAHDKSSYQFDINYDGIADFRLNSTYDISPGGVNQRYVSIEVLNPAIQISVDTLLDSIYECINMVNDTLISVTSYNKYSGYSCPGNYYYSFLTVDSTICPIIYAKGDAISNQGNWTANKLYLSSFIQNSFWVTTPVQSTYILTGNWNKINMKYLLFRMKIQNNYLYGWLKLSIDEYIQIRFYEYALQNG